MSSVVVFAGLLGVWLVGLTLIYMRGWDQMIEPPVGDDWLDEEWREAQRRAIQEIGDGSCHRRR